MSDQTGLGTDRLKHLEFVQAVVTRLANGSFLIKGWTLTVAAAFFAVVVNNLNAAVAAIGLVPIVAFWFLDGVFLRNERQFRKLYDDVADPTKAVKSMSMNIAPYEKTTTWAAAAFSQTLLLFYGALVLVDLALVFGAIRK